MTSQERLAHFSLLLRNAAPETWEAFCKAFATLSDEFTVAVTEAPADEILRKQGQAQAMRLLLRLFKECGLARG